MRLWILFTLLLCVRGQLITRGLISPSNRKKSADDCKCWITWYYRSACSQGKDLRENSCIDAGCCYYDDPLHYQAPRCYQRTGTCPPQECRVKPDEREECRIPNRLFIPRHLCQNNGCCFDQFAKPNCYKAKAAYVPAPYKPQTHPYFAKLDDRNKPHLFQKIERLGPFRFVSSCYVSRNRCGKVGVTRSQCVRFGCCWQPNRNFGVQEAECFRSVRFWLNYPGTFITMDGASWADWSQWSQCGGSPCFSGTQTRTRSCTNDYLPHMKCSGPTSETRMCTVPCPGADWGPFVPGACVSADPVCFIGSTVETRVCLLSGVPVPSSNCIGESIRTAKCNTHLCESYGPFTPGTCSRTCGGGTITSTRQCLSPVTSSPPWSCLSKQESCNEQACPRLSQWTTWSQCVGEQCSTGQQTRSRICLEASGCSESLMETQQCSTSCGAEWGEWSQGSCVSAEPQCLAGTRTNTRVCMVGVAIVPDSNCVGSSTETVPCNTHLCSSFSAYTPGTCSQSCGGGSILLTRVCLDTSTVSSQSCLEKSEVCNIQACPTWTDWTPFGPCIGSPCSIVGTQSRSRTCIPPEAIGNIGCDGPTTETQDCSTTCNADWGDWMEGSCDSLDPDCLAGTRLDTRICLNGGVTVDNSNCVGSNTQTVACNTHLCSSSFSAYTPGMCSRTCGGGSITSTRVCLGTATSLPQSCLELVESCNEQMCPILTDVAFLIDGSTALGSSNFQLVLSGISQLIGNLDINTGNTRVGALRYDDDAIAQIFPSSSTTSAVQTQILSIVFRGGNGFISQAIQFAATLMFDNTRSRKRAVIYAHAPPSDLTALSLALTAAGINNVELFVVALGSTLPTEFNSVAGSSNRVWLNDLSNPGSVQTQVINFINS